MKFKNMMGIMSKLFYIATILMILISYITGEFFIFGFISLLIAGLSGLITEFMKSKRIIMIIFHMIVVIFSVYILFVFISFDLVPTMIYY